MRAIADEIIRAPCLNEKAKDEMALVFLGQIADNGEEHETVTRERWSVYPQGIAALRNFSTPVTGVKLIERLDQCVHASQEVMGDMGNDKADNIGDSAFSGRERVTLQVAEKAISSGLKEIGAGFSRQ